MHETGAGLPRDLQAAYKWLSLAAVINQDPRQKTHIRLKLKTIQRKMTADQIVQAQDAAAAWYRHHRTPGKALAVETVTR